ncbi:hypothetical protein [Curtobacterium sp. MCBA15_001]|uniref:hypothetical protein n=1 Tax=Curtobacterium sp. MCBA15_001 TaxID=1898731 RepID=UPI0008DD75D8|nr:hypothetical protein [Curtobacterium sp. MCBA15_001]OIH93608.1 hypothetical protein BIU90_08030 [Curtobacterium sp. MCBA15_001]
MSTDGPGEHGRHRGWIADEDEDDDLGRAFGPDTASVPTRTTPQRVRSWSLLLAGVVVVAIVIVVVLGTITGRVQDGIGGMFPRPQAALDGFVADARPLEGVTAVREADPTKTSFTSYDVTATVTASESLDAARQTALVEQLSAEAKDASGTGVHVWAVADLGTVDVGVSPSAARTRQRLELGRQLSGIAGVEQVRCVWTERSAGRSDAPADQSVSVETAATGVDVAAVQAQATEAVQRVFPGAAVTVTTARS